MAGPLNKVHKGDRLEIHASTFNTLVDVALDHQRRKHDTARQAATNVLPSGIVLVRNDSGADRARFDVLGIPGPVLTPTDNIESFKNRVVVVGDVPGASDSGRFVILAEPIADGSFGRAYIDGVCPARVEMDDESHGFADVTDGETATLFSTAIGTAQLLWVEPVEDRSDPAIAWTIIRIAGGGSGGSSGAAIIDARPTVWKQITSTAGGRQYLYRFKQVDVGDSGLLFDIPGGIDSDTVVVLTQPSENATFATLDTPIPGTVLNPYEGTKINFEWSAASTYNSEDAIGYRLKVGTMDGGAEIADSDALSAGTLSYLVDVAWPNNDNTVYVTLETAYPTETVSNKYTFVGVTSIANLFVHVTGASAIPDGVGAQPDGISDLEVDSTLRIGVLGGGPVPWPVPDGEPASVYGVPENSVPVRLEKRAGSNVWRCYESVPRSGLCSLVEPQRAEDTDVSVVTSPVDGSTLATDSQTFTWSTIAGADGYILYVGTDQGGFDYFKGTLGTGTSQNVTGLPEDSSTIYVRIWTKVSSNPAWFFNDYRYTASS
jgi:hypothetical protein